MNVIIHGNFAKGSDTMKTFKRSLSTVATLAVLCGSVLALVPAAAQTYGDVPRYTTWQSDWDHGNSDRHHVILGTISDFHPYRLTVQRRNGNVQTVDLKNGTRIYPIGATPTPGERVALVGYYSNGTFIANRVVLNTNP